MTTFSSMQQRLGSGRYGGYHAGLSRPPNIALLPRDAFLSMYQKQSNTIGIVTPTAIAQLQMMHPALQSRLLQPHVGPGNMGSGVHL